MEVISSCLGVAGLLRCPTRFWAPSPVGKGCTVFVSLQHEKDWHTVGNNPKGFHSIKQNHFPWVCLPMEVSLPSEVKAQGSAVYLPVLCYSNCGVKITSHSHRECSRNAKPQAPGDQIQNENLHFNRISRGFL